jgi:RimJ/RimL family protein N-acetyltransferase
MRAPIREQPLGEPLPEVSASGAKLPELVTLEGRTVTVRPLDPVADAEDLYRNTAGCDYLWTYMLAGPFAGRESFDTYLRNMSNATDRVAFAIVDKALDEVTGLSCYLRIEPAHRVIEVGSIVFSPKLQRTVAATEAMYLMARYAFEELGYRRYEWRCNALNAASRHAALRLGFKWEGELRRHMIVKGRNRDTVYFSMLDSEWPARKTALEQWLDPSNFDEGGRQKRRLSDCHSPQGTQREKGLSTEYA